MGCGAGGAPDLANLVRAALCELTDTDTPFLLSFHKYFNSFTELWLS